MNLLRRTGSASSLLWRSLPFVACTLGTMASLLWRPGSRWGYAFALVFGALAALGIADLLQPRRAVLRNYPIIGHLRYLLESIRPEIRQYLLEADDEKLPFSRAQRSLVYQRAKSEPSEKAFGTLGDVYRAGHEFVGHSMRPAPEADPAGFRITVGGPDCTRPYSASIFNISALSFGALSANAIRSLNLGAREGGFAHDTGEGSISPYHLEHGGDLVWEIGSGYFGCRTADGQFDAERFVRNAALPQVRMIEIKLSQGAKPGHGGILPAHKVSAEIAATRGVPMGVDCVSPARHSAFDSPVGLLRFVARLRELSGGKPVGFKLCVGHPWEFMAIVKAMLATGITPDFVVVDGAEGGTGAAPLEFADHIGMPMREGLLFVHNALVGAGLRERIRIGTSGKIVSAFDIACVLALGADWANSARGFMFAVGCIQSQSCHTNRCPTGVATQDPLRQRALVPADKAVRVRDFHRNTLHALAQMLAAAGLDGPSALRPHHLQRRVSAQRVVPFSALYRFLAPGELLRDGGVADEPFRSAWLHARADSFEAAPIAWPGEALLADLADAGALAAGAKSGAAPRAAAG
ncbi:MAG: FMN-binding glutamate synthase family protein [Steroidobacteraceae bacterium]|jgi:glutamate synthase domain-containing protein 2